VRLTPDRPQDRQSLSGDLKSAFAKKVGWIGRHGSVLEPSLD